MRSGFPYKAYNIPLSAEQSKTKLLKMKRANAKSPFPDTPPEEGDKI